MFCIVCGAPNPDAAKFCHKCGQAMVSSTQGLSSEEASTNGLVSAPQDQEPLQIRSSLPAPSARPVPTARLTRRNIVLLCFALVWCYLLAFTYHRPLFGGFFSPEVFGAWLGLLIWPLVLTYLLRGRRKPRDWQAIARMFIWSAILLPALVLSINRQHRETTEERLRSVFQDAAAPSAPGQRSLDSDEQALRDFLRDLIALNKRYSEEAAKFDTPEMEVLYQPVSFSKRNTVQRTIDQIKEMEDLEDEMNKSYDDIVGRARTRIHSQTFWEGFEESNAHRQNVFALERKWLDASLDLYQFALANLHLISVKGDKVYVEDSALDSFNEKLSTAENSRETFLRSYEQFQQRQKEYLSRWGLSPSDMGMPAEGTGAQR